MNARTLAIVMTMLVTMLGLVQLGDPDVLGVTRQFMAWCGILAAGGGVLLGFLPPVQGPKP